MKTVCKARIGTEKRQFGILVAVLLLMLPMSVFGGSGTNFAVGVVIGLVTLLVTVFFPKVWDNMYVVLGTFAVITLGLAFIIIRYLLTLNILGLVIMFLGMFVGGWALKKYGPILWKKLWVAAGCPEESIKLPEESK